MARESRSDGISAKYDRNYMLADIWVCLGVTAAAAALLWWPSVLPEETICNISKKADTVYAAAAGLAGSLLGFVLAAVSVLLAVVPSPRLRVLRKSSHTDELWNVNLSAIKWCGASCIGSLLALLLTEPRTLPGNLAALLGFFLFCVAASRVGHCVRFLGLIIKVVGGDTPPPR